MAVIDLSGDPQAQLLAKQLRIRLANHDALMPIVDSALDLLLTGDFLEDEDQSALVEARASKNRAENELAEFRFSEAAADAWSGQDKLNDVDPAAAVALYADLAFVLGQAKLGEHKPDEANQAFAFVHRLQPNRRVDPTRYLPEVVAAFDKAKPAAPKIEIEIHGTGRVWIDGVAVGEGDGTYQVAPGLHVVQLAGPDRQPRGLRIKAPLDKPIEVEPAPASDELKIKRARLALSRAHDATDRSTAMRRLAELTKVKDAVLITSVSGKLKFQNWRADAPGYDAPVFTNPSERDRDKPDQPLDWLAPRKPPPSRAPDKKIEIPPEPERWYQKRWVQASIVSSVIAIIGGGIVWAELGPGTAGVNTKIGIDSSATRPR